MADPIANVVVSMPAQLFTRSDRFSAVANGKIYVGIIDTDPTVAGNQIQAYIENEDGSLTAIPQPLRLNAGGYPVYNGQVVKFVTEEGHSMAVLTSTDVQMFYFPNVLRYNPDQFGNQLAADGGAGMVGFSYSSNYPASTLGSRNKNIVCVLDKPFLADPTFTNDSYSAIQAAINFADANNQSVVWIPSGRYILTQGLVIPPGITVIGDGVDYWDTFRPAAGRLLKSWKEGTHLVFTGTGNKSSSIINLMNARPIKSVGGISFPFTDFTNNDSVNGASATAKPFSVAVKTTHACQIKNLRIMLSNNGIAGYNDATTTSLGDNWDVGLWSYDGSQSIVDNVQVVGYWRIGAILVTENDGTYSMVGNPECMTFNNIMTQGRRGLIVRNSAQIDVYSHTDTTLVALYNSSFTLSSDMKFRTLGSSQVYTFSSYTVSGSQITLTGISPNLPTNVPVIRAANGGNNFSGTVFSNFKACSLDHTSGNNSASLGLGEAGAMEIDGYPVRNLKFINFKAQTTFDRLNTLYGDMRDAKLVSCEHENGAMIAYSNSETIGYTNNIRFINSDIQSSTDTTAFTPRDCFIDYKQFPTQNTDGSFIIKNWRDNDISLQSFSGVKLFNYRSSDLGVDITNGASFRYLASNGATNETTLFGKNISVKNSTGLNYLQMFDASLSATFAGVVSAVGGVVATVSVRPAVANGSSCGTAAFPWSGGWTQTAFTVTSDETAKQDIRPLEDRERDVGRKLKDLVVAYRLKDRVESKGDDARLHIGVIAQRVIEAFESEGLNYGDYGIVCHEEWDEVPADEETGSPAVPAGSGYTVRYEELMMLIIGSM